MIKDHGVEAARWRRQIKEFEEMEKGTNTIDVQIAAEARVETQRFLDKAEKAIEVLGVFRDQVIED